MVSSSLTDSSEKPCLPSGGDQQHRPSSISTESGSVVSVRVRKSPVAQSKRNYRKWFVISLVAVLALIALATLAAAIYLFTTVDKKTTTTSTQTTTTQTTTTATTATSTTQTTVTTQTTTTTTTSSFLPSQCSTATVITDSTRNVAYSVASGLCDQTGPLATPGWYRFTGVGGTMLANHTVASSMCGTQATGWYTGVHPSSPSATVAGTVCYNWSGNSCSWSNTISVTNCNGSYVYDLSPPPVCILRYCTM